LLGSFLGVCLHAANRPHPSHVQVLDFVAVDLGELGIARRAVIAVHHQPVLRLVCRLDEPVAIDRHLVLGGLRRDAKRGERDADQGGIRDNCEASKAVRHFFLLKCWQFLLPVFVWGGDQRRVFLLFHPTHWRLRGRGSHLALLAGRGVNERLLRAHSGSGASLRSELAPKPPPDPLHGPSKTGVNALMASGERENTCRALNSTQTRTDSLSAPNCRISPGAGGVRSPAPRDTPWGRSRRLPACPSAACRR